MALKADANNPLDYLNKMLEDNGFEIIIPDEKKKEEKKKKEDKKEDKK